MLQTQTLRHVRDMCLIVEHDKDLPEACRVAAGVLSTELSVELRRRWHDEQRYIPVQRASREGRASSTGAVPGTAAGNHPTR